MSQPTHNETDVRKRRARLLAACAAVFLVALGVRALHWQDNRHDFVFAGMAEEYKAHALLLARGDVRGFIYGNDPQSDADVFKHPPGHPLLAAAVYWIAGDANDFALRLLHVALDASAALLVFLLALKLFDFVTALVAGMLIAISPQLAYHAIALIPDAPAVPPLLAGMYLLACAWKKPRLLTIVGAGALIGVSCWLRSNALLLAPFLAVLVVPFIFPRGKRLLYAAALVGSCALVIAPVTVRNYVATRRFIPLSLSAGITFVEGIGIYDTENKFGLPSSDYAVTKWEAQKYGRLDYLGTRFKPDGFERERGRIKSALTVVRENPVWFLGVMTHRAFSMLRLARVERVAPWPAVTNPLEVAPNAPPAASVAPHDFSAPLEGEASQATSSAAATGDDARMRFDGAARTSQTLLVSPPLAVEAHTDYALRVPLLIRDGSLVVDVLDARGNEVLASSTVLHPINYLELAPGEQPAVIIKRPFVSADARAVRIALRHGGRRDGRVDAEIGRTELFALGSSSHAWTRAPRFLLRALQSFFLTAWMLPLAVLGALLLLRARRWRELILLLAVPAYYMCVQSALWTEFRYVLAMHYLLPVLSAVGLYRLGAFMFASARKLATRRA